MEIEHIKFHIDNGISIRCKQSGEKELRKLTPEHLRSVIVSYDISLIHDPLKKVKETCRITNRNIEYSSPYFTLFFPLENILQPHESQITFRSLTFLSHDSGKMKHSIDETYSLLELQKNSIEHSIPSTKGITQGQTPKNLQKGKPSASGTIHTSSHEIITTTKEELTHLFEDSYQKFLKDFQNSQVQDLVKTKKNSLEFNMKNFGISLLCKLLLLVKYFNELVDNDFQADLNTFLQQNLLDTTKLGGLV